MTVSEVLSEAIVADDRTLRRLALDSQVDPAVVRRLVSEGVGIHSENVDRLATGLGMELVKKTTSATA